ncbi:hypothetical protein GF373_00595 [bacterium]|nr:hypothetical protein [bacterium]
MKVMDNHHKAMELANQADFAKQQGNNTEAKDLYFEAFKYERAAAPNFFPHSLTNACQGTQF